MARPLTRARTLENRAFLAALAETGNIREAARRCGLKPSTLHYRRSRHPAFAIEWEATVALADARFRAGGGLKRPEAVGGRRDPLRTAGGEPMVMRRADGKLQFRRAHPGQLTVACEQAFLAALSATANVTLAAAAAGVHHAAFYYRRRTNPGFAREMRLALERGCERLEFALIHGFTAESHKDDAWRHNDPPAIPPMNPDQALQLLHLHEKTVRLGLPRPPDRLRRGESVDQWSARMAAITRAGERRKFEDAEVARAAGRAPPAPSRFEGDMAVYHVAEKLRLAAEAAARADPVRPRATVPYAAVRADPADEDEPTRRVRKTRRAMFGGWRFQKEE